MLWTKKVIGMDASLIEMLLPYTPEEERLLAGGEIDLQAYTDRGFFLVEGKKFIRLQQMIALRAHTRFTDFPPHGHDYVEMMYQLQGETVHHMPDGSRIHLQAGELLLINRHSSHSIDRCAEADVAVNFIIRPAFFERVPELIGTHNVLGNFLLDALRSDEKAVSYLHFRIAGQKAVQLLLQSMVHSYLQEKPAGRLISQTQMALLFLHLLAEPESLSLPADTQKENRYVLDLLQEVRLHYDSFSLKAYARSRHVSSAYLSRVAHAATGKTITQLLQERRIERAKKLLTETDLTVIDICMAVGYSNSSYFYRIFEAAEGMSPTAYRVNAGCT